MAARMQPHEIDAWLGPARDDLSDEQYERFAREADRIAARYPDADDADESSAALSATLAYLLGDSTPESVAEDLADARRRLSEAMAAAQQVAAMLVTDGRSEVRAAETMGIDRMTLRKALGKR